MENNIKEDNNTLHNIMINPDTGEKVLLGESEKEAKEFSKIAEEINENFSIIDSNDVFSEKEMIDALDKGEGLDQLDAISEGTEYNTETIKKILNIINRKLSGEKIKAYQEFPDEVKEEIDKYVSNVIIANSLNIKPSIQVVNTIKNNISDTLINEFINSIKTERSKHDFALELQQIYESTGRSIDDEKDKSVEERNKDYREAISDIEDSDKKEKLNHILDYIEDARSLTSMKEFSKKCKIKDIQIRKYNREFSNFLYKYKNSSNNIYDINLAKKTLERKLGNEFDAILFLLCFINQTSRYSVNIATYHAYMYYVIYYCINLDFDNSELFLNSIKEVIENLKIRNNL